MFDVNKPKQAPAVLIRNASGSEFNSYEKQKLAQNGEKSKAAATVVRMQTN